MNRRCTVQRVRPPQSAAARIRRVHGKPEAPVARAFYHKNAILPDGIRARAAAPALRAPFSDLRYDASAARRTPISRTADRKPARLDSVAVFYREPAAPGTAFLLCQVRGPPRRRGDTLQI